MEVAVRVMNEPQEVRLGVSTADLNGDNFFRLAAAQIIPDQKSASNGTASFASRASPGRSLANQKVDGDRSELSPTPSNSSRPRRRSHNATTQRAVAGTSSKWLDDVLALRRELNATQNGPGWVAYLMLDELERIATAQSSGEQQSDSGTLNRIRERFEKTAANPTYVSIGRRRSFVKLLELLRQQP